jgi:hypothetical protein
MITKILTGYNSENNAYLVPDYPYGRKLRCKIRYWIESDDRKGFRFCAQTENPKTLQWNNPKKGTYCKIAMMMYLDEREYVQHAALSEYSGEDEVLSFIKSFPDMDEDNRRSLLVWCKMKEKLADEMIKGTAYFTTNGVKQEQSEADIERLKKDREVWGECFRSLERNKQ